METPWTMRRIALATLTVVASITLAYTVYIVRDSLIIVFIGILFGLAIKGPVASLQRLRVPRSIALLVVLVGVLAAVPVVLLLLLPTLVNALTVVVVTAFQGYEALAGRLPTLPFLQSLSLETVAQNIVTLVTTNTQSLVGSAVGFGATIAGGFINLVTIVTIGFLWLLEEKGIRTWLIALVPSPNRRVAETIWREIEAQLGGYLRGLIILSVITGVLCGIGYGVIGLRLALAFGILAGLMEIIPIPGIGLTLTAIFVGLSTFPDSPTQAIAAVIWTVIVFQGANMILFPRIMGDALGISALAVIVALLVFVTLLGPVGALLAIPLAAIIQIVVEQTLLTRNGPPSEADHLTSPDMEGI